MREAWTFKFKRHAESALRPASPFMCPPSWWLRCRDVGSDLGSLSVPLSLGPLGTQEHRGQIDAANLAGPADTGPVTPADGLGPHPTGS